MYKHAKGYYGTRQRPIPKQADGLPERVRVKRELEREQRDHIANFPKTKRPGGSIVLKEAKARFKQARAYRKGTKVDRQNHGRDDA